MKEEHGVLSAGISFCECTVLWAALYSTLHLQGEAREGNGRPVTLKPLIVKLPKGQLLSETEAESNSHQGVYI